MDLRIKINQEQLQRARNKLLNLVKGDKLKMGITRALIHIQNEVVKNITTGKYGVKTRTGRLRASFTHAQNFRVSQIGKDQVVGILGSNVVYARIQEFGGQTGGNKSVNIKPHYYLRNTMRGQTQKITRIVSHWLFKDF